MVVVIAAARLVVAITCLQLSRFSESLRSEWAHPSPTPCISRQFLMLLIWCSLHTLELCASLGAHFLQGGETDPETAGEFIRFLKARSGLKRYGSVRNVKKSQRHTKQSLRIVLQLGLVWAPELMLLWSVPCAVLLQLAWYTVGTYQVL